MMGCLQLRPSAAPPLPGNNRRRPLQHSHHRPLIRPPQCALTKQGERFLFSLAAKSAADDPSTVNRLIRKFVASSSKSVALNALSCLLSPTTTHPHLSSLAFPLYSLISEAAWFSWNPKLAAEVIALLYKQERLIEAEALISETVSELGLQTRELCNFYCHLLDSHSRRKSERGVFESCERLNQLLSDSSSLYLRRRGYESTINALCAVGRAREAEKLTEEMRNLGIGPSAFEFKSIVYAYGRSGLLEDMKRVVAQMESEGFCLDTVCSNMVLSSFGAHGKLSEMVIWLRKTKTSGIAVSIRTCNSVLNSCPTLTSLIQQPKNLPLSIQQLTEILKSDEAGLVHELIESSVLNEVTECDSSEMKLDLHGMHLGTAYLMVLKWLDELRSGFSAGNGVIPTQITVVCGRGRHGNVRGESPVKSLVKEMMVRMKSPMRVDRKNIGCFVAKGKVVKEWLC